jgi:uncharacterized protein YbjT (DUF2867 family)
LRVLIAGVSGLIGSTLAARLTAEGFDVIGVSRSPPLSKIAKHYRIDIAQAAQPSDWFAALAGVDAVVNCAGTLQDGGQQSTEGVHVRGTSALFSACEQRGIRRVVHLSAVGVDRSRLSNFSITKLRGDQDLMARKLDWVILRPSFVIGPPAYGGSALFRGLAALPIVPILRDAEAVQPVHLDDVIETIRFFLRPEAPAREILELVGPRSWTITEIVLVFREWLRWPDAKLLALPDWLAALACRGGDAARWLGWRPAIATSSQKELRRGATGNPARWQSVTGIEARDIEAILRSSPASVQERWFARLFALKPVIFFVFALFWMATGVISLSSGWNYGIDLLREGGLSDGTAAVTIVAGALADLAIGAAILYRPTSRLGLYAAVTISLVYVVIGTILVPRLWNDPLGPMLKIWPVLVLNLVALAILEDR